MDGTPHILDFNKHEDRKLIWEFVAKNLSLARSCKNPVVAVGQGNKFLVIPLAGWIDGSYLRKICGGKAKKFRLENWKSFPIRLMTAILEGKARPEMVLKEHPEPLLLEFLEEVSPELLTGEVKAYLISKLLLEVRK